MVFEDTDHGSRPDKKDLLWSLRTENGVRPDEKDLLYGL